MSTKERLSRIDKSLSLKQPTLHVMLDNVHSSQNLSAIIRTCDAVGVLNMGLVNFKSQKGILKHGYTEQKQVLKRYAYFRA